MRRFGQLLMGLGLTVGVAIAIAMATHQGFPGASWLINVALAKLGLVAAGGLIAGGAVGVRLANRREAQQIVSRSSGG